MFLNKTLSFLKEIIANICWLTCHPQESIRLLYSISLYRNAIYLILNSVVFAASGFLFWIIAAHFYTDVEVGRGAAAIAAVSLLMQISHLGLGFALIRFVSDSEKRAVALINSILTVGLLASLVVATIFLFGLPLWSPGLLFIRHDSVYISAFIVFTSAFTLYQLLNNVFVAKRQTKPTFYQGLIAGLVRFPLCYILAFLYASFGIFASFGIAMLLSIIISLILLLPTVQKDYRPYPYFSISLIGPVMARFAGVNYLSNFLWIAPSQLFPLIVLNVLGAEMNAYFYIAWAIANILFIIPLAIANSLFAEGSYNSKLLRDYTLRAVKINILLLVPAAGLLLLLGRFVLAIFGSAYSIEAESLLILLIISVFPLAVNHLVINILRVVNNLPGILIISSLMAVSTIGLSYVFITDYGILGVGIGWLIGQAFTAVIGAVFILVFARGAKGANSVGKQEIEELKA